jgi:SAM-dependent methyltransferase
LLKSVEKIATSPYTILSQIYDVVMDHVNYEQWANYISELADIHGMAITTIFDISCGTGTLCYKLKERGFDVFGSDISYEMLKIATLKKMSFDSYPYFYCSDLKKLPLKQKVDLIVCLYDSMNYLVNDSLWNQTLERIYSLLKSHGLFIFDVSTIYNSKTYFYKYRYQRTCAEGSYQRMSSFDEKSSIQHNIFEIRLKQRPDMLFVEHHKQLIRPLAEIQNIIERSRFQLVGFYNEFTLKPATEKVKRVHFVLKKQ